MKIILVDDEQKFVDMLAKRLKIRGIEADVVFSGEQAIQKIHRNHYDVAVLDVKMPGISGLNLKSKLEEIDPSLKCLFVTGHGAGAQLSDDEIDKQNIYLSKPLNIDTLIETINQVAEN